MVFLKHIVLVRVSVAGKRHHDHSNSYKEKPLIEVAAFRSEVLPIVIMVGHDGMQAAMVLEKMLRVLHLVGNRK